MRQLEDIQALKREDRDRILKFVSELRRALGDNLKVVMLFGSRARGEGGEDSDIDLLIVLREKDLKNREKIYDILFEIDPYYDLKISPRIFSEFEFKENERLGSPFISRVKKEGIKL
jgi:predicted nucleotidyltransferase